jgi:hypothetical protein
MEYIKLNNYVQIAFEAILTGISAGLGVVAVQQVRDWESAAIGGVLAACGVALSSIKSLKTAVPGQMMVDKSSVVMVERKDEK